MRKREKIKCTLKWSVIVDKCLALWSHGLLLHWCFDRNDARDWRPAASCAAPCRIIADSTWLSLVGYKLRILLSNFTNIKKKWRREFESTKEMLNKSEGETETERELHSELSNNFFFNLIEVHIGIWRHSLCTIDTAATSIVVDASVKIHISPLIECHFARYFFSNILFIVQSVVDSLCFLRPFLFKVHDFCVPYRVNDTKNCTQKKGINTEIHTYIVS